MFGIASPGRSPGCYAMAVPRSEEGTTSRSARAASAHSCSAGSACTAAECEAKRQQEAYDAREQLRAQKEELAELTDSGSARKSSARGA
jgi:hypothetical protein